MGGIKELTIYDFEDLWYAATELVYLILINGMMLDEEGNYAGFDENRTRAWSETINSDPRFKYLNFRECEELKQYTLADVCDLSASEILEKYLSATLPVYHKAMRSGKHLLIGFRASDDIPDAYLDQLFAMAWKADLKMWALQWDKEKSARENDNCLSSKQIESGCPKCGNEPANIELWNCGPIVRIRCPKCGFVCNEYEGREKGYEDIFDYWNHLNPDF